ncbi:hypothetical protein [Streptomyces sp. NPDC054834]
MTAPVLAPGYVYRFDLTAGGWGRGAGITMGAIIVMTLDLLIVWALSRSLLDTSGGR